MFKKSINEMKEFGTKRGVIEFIIKIIIINRYVWINVPKILP